MALPNNRWPPHDCYPNWPDINGCTCAPMCSGWKEHNTRMNQQRDPALRIEMKNDGYTAEQINSMTLRLRTLPRDELISHESLFRSLVVLRNSGDFTTPGVLERHYGLVVPPKTCQGLHGACRYKPNHDGDCDVVF